MDTNFTDGKTMKPLMALLEAAGYIMGEQELGLTGTVTMGETSYTVLT